MNIRIIEDTFIGGVYKAVGDTASVDQATGEYLISLGRAVEVGPVTLPIWDKAEARVGRYVVLSPYTTNAEMRLITGVSATEMTVNAGFDGQHGRSGSVVYLDTPEFLVELFGATGDGETDDADAINNAILQGNLSGGGAVAFLGRTYMALSTIVMQRFITLRLSRNTIITTTADINLISFTKRCGIEGNGGQIFINNAAYTKAALYFAGSEQILPHYNRSNRIEHLNLDCIGNGGIGIHMYSDGDNGFDYVTGVVFDQVQITRFEYAVRMQAVEGVEDICFVNDNRFSNCYFLYNIYPVSIEGDGYEPNAANGNMFTNCTIQPGAMTIRGIYLEGSRNTFVNLMIWDWQLPTAPTAAIHFGPRSFANRIINVQVDAHTIIDEGELNDVESVFYRTSPLGQISDTSAESRVHAQYGLHDNQLAWANDEMSIAQTAGSAATSGSWANVFGNSLDQVIQWGPSPAPTLPITFEITFGLNLYGVSGIGINFLKPHVPGGLIIELYDGAGAAYDTIYDTTGHGDKLRNLYVPLIAIEDGYLYRAKYYTKMRVTIKSLGEDATAVAISNILLHSSHHPGRRWVPRKNPSILGNLTASGTAIVNNSASTDLIQAKRSTDSYNRFILNNSGQMYLGDGSYSPVLMLHPADNARLRIPDGITLHAGNGAWDGGHFYLRL